MAQGTLVTGLIEDGLELINRLLRGGFPVAAAWWVKPVEEPGANGDWQFFLASPLVDQLGPGVAYQKAHGALRNNPNFDPVLARISLGMIKIIGVSNPITEEIFKVIKRFRGIPPIYVARCRLGDLEAEEVHIYALRPPAPWQQVILKTPVEVEEPLSPQESQAMSEIVASGMSPVRVGWPKSLGPAGTVMNARVLGADADPDPLLLVVSLDGRRRGITHKSNTESVQVVTVPQ